MTALWILAWVVAAVLIAVSAFAFLTRRRIPVLMYHRIGEVPGDRNTMPPEQFRRELDYLKSRGFHTVMPHEMLSAAQGLTRLPRRSVMLTFDDATLDTRTVVMDELLKRGMKGCVFAIASLAASGGEYTGGKAPSPVMTGSDLAAWRDAGMATGSHTLNHAPLGMLNGEPLEHELRESRAVLEKMLGVTVDILCYPYGSLSAEAKNAARQAGYVMAFAIVSGVPFFRFDPYAVPRLGSSSGQSMTEFRLKVSPLFSFMVFFRSLEYVFKKMKRRKKQ